MAKLKDADKDFMDRVLIQCAYSLGCGAQMPISGQALRAFGAIAEGM